MTIGVATMANNGLLVFAADRMITRGVDQTEPESAKIYHLPHGHPVTVLWAGSAEVFGEVIQTYIDRAQKLLPTNVLAAVYLYCACFAEYVSRRAEREILTRVGLTRMDLISSKVSDRRAAELLDLMFSFDLGEHDHVETIWGGHDSASGVHLYRTYDAKHYCSDVEGFAAIGTGAERAISHLGFSGHTPKSDPFAATINAYFAKRRAEQASGVGRQLDMATRTAGAPALAISAIGGDVGKRYVAALDDAYTAFLTAEQAALVQAKASATVDIQAAFATPPSPAEAPTPAPPPASTDGS